MPRRPRGVHIPSTTLQAATRAIEEHLNRVLVEASDYRTFMFYYPVMATNQTVTLGGSPSFNPYRDRRFIKLQVAAYAWVDTTNTAHGTNGVAYPLTATLYNGAIGSGTKIIEVALAITSSVGYKSGSSETILNAGKQHLTPSNTWCLRITTGGTLGKQWEWADISVEVTYEDYSPYIDRTATVS